MITLKVVEYIIGIIFPFFFLQFPAPVQQVTGSLPVSGLTPLRPGQPGHPSVHPAVHTAPGVRLPAGEVPVIREIPQPGPGGDYRPLMSYGSHLAPDHPDTRMSPRPSSTHSEGGVSGLAPGSQGGSATSRSMTSSPAHALPKGQKPACVRDLINHAIERNLQNEPQPPPQDKRNY